MISKDVSYIKFHIVQKNENLCWVERPKKMRPEIEEILWEELMPYQKGYASVEELANTEFPPKFPRSVICRIDRVKGMMIAKQNNGKYITKKQIELILHIFNAEDFNPVGFSPLSVQYILSFIFQKANFHIKFKPTHAWMQRKINHKLNTTRIHIIEPLIQKYFDENATKIQGFWKMVLARRKLERLRINQEIELYPNLGIKYYECLSNFQSHI